MLVGEVWLGSGQSNMAQTVRQYPRDRELARLAATSRPRLRLLRQEPEASWEPSTPETNQGFSAELFAFGCRLEEKLEVPVGLMVGAVGATPSGAWITPAMFAADTDVQSLVRRMEVLYDVATLRREFDAEREAWAAANGAADEAARTAGKPPPRPGPAPIRPASTFGREPAEVPPQTDPDLSWVDFRRRPRNNEIAIWARCTPEFSYALQHAIPKTPGTFLVPTTDLGAGVHPALKSAYGRRAADVALGALHDTGEAISGPVHAGHAVEGPTVRLRFTHVGLGLTPRHSDRLQGFLIAGADRRFYWADARIDGDTLVVSSPSVREPVAVRYAWAARFPWANLFNKDGFAAQPFRTDDW